MALSRCGREKIECENFVGALHVTVQAYPKTYETYESTSPL